jgi:hypothetical protein
MKEPYQRHGHKVIAGLIIGSFFYLIASCYVDHRLDLPKIERGQSRFTQGGADDRTATHPAL